MQFVRQHEYSLVLAIQIAGKADGSVLSKRHATSPALMTRTIMQAVPIPMKIDAGSYLR
jgi:hypothetical protein